MSRILVTGGMGFIGAHLVERLHAQGHIVHVVDDLSNTPIVPSGLAETAGIIFHHNFLRSFLDLNSSLFDKADSHALLFDQVYHLASPVGAVGILRYAGEIAHEIIRDIHHLVKVIQWTQPKHCRFVYVSTSEIYGGGVDGLCAEDTPRHISATTTARLEYAIGKLAGETAVLNTPDLDAVIVRPFNVCGTRQRSKGGFVLPRFIEQALANQPLTVFGDGTQVRAFTNVADIVDGLLLAMAKGGTKQAYNLGNPANKTTVLDLAHRVQQLVADVPIAYTDGVTLFGAAYAEASDKYPDASKAMCELGWAPSRTIDETINEVATYMRESVR